LGFISHPDAKQRLQKNYSFGGAIQAVRKNNKIKSHE
jgi:hypothetical protein